MFFMIMPEPVISTKSEMSYIVPSIRSTRDIFSGSPAARKLTVVSIVVVRSGVGAQ